MKKQTKKWFFAFICMFTMIALGSCSDEGNVHYADDAFVYELCGLSPSAEEALKMTSEETTQVTQSMSGDTGEEQGMSGDTGEEQGMLDGTGETQDARDGTGEAQDMSDSTAATQGTQGSTGEAQDTSDRTGEAQGSSEGTTETVKPSESTFGMSDLALRNLVIGSWRSDPISVEAMVTEAVSGESWLVPYLAFDPEKLTVRVTMDFSEDGKAVLNVEEKSYRELMAYMKEAVSDGVLRYFESYVKNLGLNLSVKQYLKMTGVSIDNYVADVIEASAGDLSMEVMRYQCLYDVLDGKLCVSETAMGIYLRECYFEMEISDSQLKLIQYFENGKEGDLPMGLDVKLPILLHKVPTWKGISQ